MTSTKAATNAANRSSLSWSPHLGIAAPPRELCPTPYRFGPTLIARPCDAVVLVVWMRDVLGASDHLESFGQSARIERRIVAGVGAGGHRAQAFVHDPLR